MLKALGAEVVREGTTVKLKGRPELKGRKIQVPGDISSAAFLIVAAAILPGSDIIIKGVGINYKGWDT
ncbi:hypothetical protein N752_22360 [Desulforamulus aquiferis]|nr:hypothetical protein N752_22360 [Desulforamulus aquiferis]